MLASAFCHPAVHLFARLCCGFGWLAVVCLCLLGLVPLHAQATGADVFRLTQAEMAFGEGAVPPERGWTPVILPDHFHTHAHPSDRTGWYRMAFDLPAVPDGPRVLLVQRVVMTAEFRLNGSLLNPGVRFHDAEGPISTAMLNWPHWIVLPQGLFKAGRNELLIRLKGDPVTPAWISDISIGPPDELRGEFLLRDIPQRLVPQALFVLLLAALVFCLRVWWRQRLPLQGLVLTTTVLWLGTLGIYLSTDLPVPWRVTVGLLAALWIAFHWALMQLLWRLSDGAWPWFPKLLTIGSVLPLLGAVFVLATEPSEPVLGLLMLPMALLRCLTTVMLLRWAWRVRTWSATLLTASELLWFAGPVQLMLVVLDVLPPAPFMLDPGAALPMFLVLLWLAAQHLGREREEALLQRQAAVLAERQRMMLDMHDGIGSQLVTALRMARREELPRSELATVIQEALNDLRLIIQAQDEAAGELHTLLQQWRQHNALRHGALGPHLQWELSELPAARPLSPPEALQILRILQEALSNAVQHARCRTIRIALSPLPAGCELRVCDDGDGIADTSPGGQGRGKGLESMKRRASRIGAQLDIRPAEGGGTAVHLLLPDPTRA